jgi:hypothetical protein
MSSLKRVRISKFLKEHILGIALLALITGVLGNYCYDFLKQHSTTTHVVDSEGPVTAERPLKISLLKQSSDETGRLRNDPHRPHVPDMELERTEPEFVVTSVYRVSIFEDPPGFEFELYGPDKVRWAEFTRQHLGRFVLLEWGSEPLAALHFDTTVLDGCIRVSPAEKWSMTEFFYLYQLYALGKQN